MPDRRARTTDPDAATAHAVRPAASRPPRTATHRLRNLVLGVLAFAATLAVGTYQRRTGPSWPVSVDATLGGARIHGRLPRSHGGAGDAGISLQAGPGVTGELAWRRFPTDDPWTRVPLVRDPEGGALTAALPHQPPAAKLEYLVHLEHGSAERSVPAGRTVTLRFRGAVPAWALVPHILFMFAALWVAFRAGLAALAGERGLRSYFPWVLGILVPGGLILGPLVQKLAFGALWTGWPFGDDWTDNKTLAAILIWAAAWWFSRGSRAQRAVRVAVVAALVVMLAVYLIPHSMNGSQLDWSAMDSPPAAG